MDKEYRMDVIVEAETDKPRIFHDVLSMLEEEGISAKAERDANGDVCVIAFAMQSEKWHERDMANRFLLVSQDWKKAALRIGYEERESGAYGYGVVQDGKVLDAFLEERRERASPLEEELRTAILKKRKSFEEAYRLHEPELDSRSDESIYLLLGWNSCQRVLSGKIAEIVEKRLPEESQPENGYGGFFRKLEPSYGELGREQLERMDEEIALSMLRIGYRPKDIAKAIQRRSPNVQVFVKQKNRGDYAKKILLAARRELGQAKDAR